MHDRSAGIDDTLACHSKDVRSSEDHESDILYCLDSTSNDSACISSEMTIANTIRLLLLFTAAHPRSKTSQLLTKYIVHVPIFIQQTNICYELPVTVFRIYTIIPQCQGYSVNTP